MISVIRKRLTFANVAMTLALVFAMSGGAYAAKKYLITSTKQISPKVLKALAGKPGPVGPQGAAGAGGPAGPNGPAGPVGPAGANGENGAPGANGKDGANGISPVGTPFSGKAHGCEEGGVELKGSNTTYVCNGAKGTNGQTGFTETLPSGKTETGNWYYRTSEGETETLLAISFNIPLSKPAKALYRPEKLVNCETVSSKEACEKHNEELEEDCQGTPNEPKAVPGVLCLYQGTLHFPGSTSIVIFGGTENIAGAVLLMFTEAEGTPPGVIESGTWAVTAQ